MPGLGQSLLPRLPIPKFSSGNPYWPDPSKIWGDFRKELWPRNSARDFMYATTWELKKIDNHGAYCVRTATINTVNLYWKVYLRHSIEQCLNRQRAEVEKQKKDKEKKKHDEKAA